MSLRTRLTLLYTGILSLILLVLGTVLLITTSHVLHREVDDNIAASASSVVKSIKIKSAPLSSREVVLPDVDVFATPDTYLQVVDIRGKVVDRSKNLGTQYLPLSEYTLQSALKGEKFYETVRAGDQKIRIFNIPLVVDRRLVGLLQVGRALATVNMLLNRLRFFIAAGGVLAVILAGLLGWLMARTALSPVERIIRTASSIESAGDLSKRVEYEGPSDELGRLAYTLNGMFDRLENMYHRLQESYELQRRFVSDASHELRTPLTTIRGNTEFILQMQDVDPAMAREALEDIASEARRLTRLLEDMLALARADAGYQLEKEEVPLADTLDNVARKARFLAGDKKFSLENKCPPDTNIKVNSDYFGQLVFILLDNAFKYSPAGSNIDLQAEKLTGGWLQITVADRGPGLAPGEETRIYDRFYRCENTRGKEGTGLGLSIAHWIVRQHGGTIEASNRPGGGSVFTVKLPGKVLPV